MKNRGKSRIFMKKLRNFDEKREILTKKSRNWQRHTTARASQKYRGPLAEISRTPLSGRLKNAFKNPCRFLGRSPQGTCSPRRSSGCRACTQKRLSSDQENSGCEGIQPVPTRLYPGRRLVSLPHVCVTARRCEPPRRMITNRWASDFWFSKICYCFSDMIV